MITKKIILKKNHALIPLTQGKFAKIDKEDIRSVEVHSWFYAVDHARSIIKGKSVRLHRFLMGKRKRSHINFKNGDRLDFRRKTWNGCLLNLSIKKKVKSQRRQHPNSRGYPGIQKTKNGSPTLGKMRSGNTWAVLIMSLTRLTHTTRPSLNILENTLS